MIYKSYTVNLIIIFLTGLSNLLHRSFSWLNKALINLQSSRGLLFILFLAVLGITLFTYIFSLFFFYNFFSYDSLCFIVYLLINKIICPLYNMIPSLNEVVDCFNFCSFLHSTCLSNQSMVGLLFRQYLPRLFRGQVSNCSEGFCLAPLNYH